MIDALLASPAANQQAAELLKEHLGSNCPEHWKADLERFIALEGNNVIGAVSGTMFDADESAYLLEKLNQGVYPAAADLKTDLENNLEMGYLHLMAVKEGYRDKGIAKELLTTLIKRFYDKDINKFVALTWKKADTDRTSSTPLARSVGLCEAATIENYWAGTNEKGIDDFCSICGSDCFCSAVVFTQSN